MTISKFATSAAVAAALVAGVLVARPASGADEVKEVRKGCEAFVAAWNLHDAKAMAGVFGNDATMVDANGKLFDGRAAIEKELTAWHGATGPMRESTLKVNDEPFKLISPDVALTDADVTVTGAFNPDGSKAGPINLLVTNIWKKSGDNWLVVASRVRAKAPSPGSAPPAK